MLLKNRFNPTRSTYSGAFLINLIALIIGVVIEIITKGQPIKAPAFPSNLILLIVLFFYPLIVNKIYKDGTAWISSIPMTVATISVYTVLVIVMGSFMQENPNAPQWQKLLGLSHIAQTWYFLFISVLLMTVLSFTILRRLHQLNKIKNISFILNHLGIWVIIASASLGTGDLQRIKLVVAPDNPSNLALNSKNNKVVPLPFSVKLDSFLMKEYHPVMIFVNPTTKQILKEFSDYSEGTEINFHGWHLKVLKYLDKSVEQETSFVPSSKIGAVHSVFLEARKGGNVLRRWISAPELNQKGSLLKLNLLEGIALLPAEVKQYRSKITILPKDKPPIKTIVSVNHPVHYQGWEIYQYDYNEQMGRWSTYSILELVKDPWLIPVYIGVFMLLIGASLLLWFGKFKK